MSAALSSVIFLLVIAVALGLVGLLFWAGYILSTKITQNINLRILLTILFGIVFNIGLVTAAVAGCIAIVGSPNFH